MISHLFILLPFHQEVTLPVPAIYPSALKCILRMPLPLMQHIIGNHISQAPLPSGFHIGLAYGGCQQKLGRGTRGGGQQHLLHRCSSFQRAPRSLCDPIKHPNIHPSCCSRGVVVGGYLPMAGDLSGHIFLLVSHLLHPLYVHFSIVGSLQKA